MNKKGETIYSDQIEGRRENYHWSVKFDLTDDSLGISQFDDDEIHRVLLSGNQVKELVKFLGRNFDGNK